MTKETGSPAAVGFRAYKRPSRISRKEGAKLMRRLATKGEEKAQAHYNRKRLVP